MYSEWPLTAGSPGQAPRAAAALPRADAAKRRVADAAFDLFIEPAYRLDDRVRAFASAMLDDLVGGLEREMRVRLGSHFTNDAEIAASLTSPTVRIALPLLRDARTLRHAPLIAILTRRAESFVLADRLLPTRDQTGLPIDDADVETASAATELFIAEARRRDRFGAPALLFDDLPAELAHWLVWRIAAALRRYLRDQHGREDPNLDAALTQAAAAILAAHDEGRGLEPTAWRLAARLIATGGATGDRLVALLEGGHVAAFNAALAAKAALPFDEAWHVIADPTDSRLALVLRAAGVSRDAAAAILLLLFPAVGEPGAEIDAFEASDEAAAAEALAPLALDPAFRAAIRGFESELSTRDPA